MGRVTIFPHFYLQNKLTDITEILLAFLLIYLLYLPLQGIILIEKQP